MTLTTELDIRRISPEAIVPDPENPRLKLRDLDSLTASVKQHGVLEPITVRPDPSANGDGPRWIVVRGHRRHAAATRAKIELIPCVVDWSDDAKARASTRLVENLQRDDLTAREQAKGVQQLLELGLSEDDVASTLSVSTEHVARARAITTSKTLAKAPAAVELSFEVASGIAEFDDQPKIAKELLKTATENPADFAFDVEQFRQQRAEQKAIAEKTAELKAAGYRILERYDWKWRYPSDSKVAEIGHLTKTADAKTSLTSAGHKDCPGRAAYVKTNYDGKVEVVEICIDWPTHGHGTKAGGARSSSRSPAKKAPTEMSAAEKREAEKKLQEGRIHRACIKAGRAAEVVRRRFVSDLLARNEAPRGTLAFAVPALLAHHLTNPKTEMFCELTGVKKPARHTANVVASYVEVLSERQLPLGLLAVVAAHVEKMWEPSTWKGGWGLERRKDYLVFLRSCGYEPALIEKVILGEAKAIEVLAEAERIKAASKA